MRARLRDCLLNRANTFSLLLLLTSQNACSSAPASPPTTKPPVSDGQSKAGLSSPARYFATSAVGPVFDEGDKGGTVMRPEFIIVRGRRAKIEAGAIVEVIPKPSDLVGFRTLPPHLGGGYLVWSDNRTFTTKDFFGTLKPLVDIAPIAGARPWFTTMLFRSDRGLLELNPKTGQIQRFKTHAGVVDALSVDGERGATIDLTGRIRITTNAGKTWSDITASRGFLSNGIRLGRKGEVEFLSLSGGAELRLLPGGSGVELVPPPAPYSTRRYYGYSYAPVVAPMQPEPEPIVPISQTLAPEALGWGIALGARLANDQVLVGTEYGVLVLSTKTGQEINRATLSDLDARYQNCQPFRAGGTLLMACVHAEGAQVLRFDGPLDNAKLEATFPGSGRFISDGRGQLAFTGRCGRNPPSADDFGARVVSRYPMPDEDPYGGYNPMPPYGGYDPEYSEPLPPSEPEKPAADDKRICTRVSGGGWVEHHLKGEDAKDLYRWVLGEDGRVVALLLKGANPEEEEAAESEESPDKAIDLDEEESIRNRKGGSLKVAPSSVFALPTALPSARPSASPSARPSASPSAYPSALPSAQPTASPKTPPPSSPTSKPNAPPRSAPSTNPIVSPKGSAKPTGSAIAKAAPEAPREALRLIRLDPKDRFLKKGKWTAPRPPVTPDSGSGVPYHVDTNFWLEADGSVRGWVRMNDDTDGGSGGDSSSDDGAEKPEVVSSERGGRFAGARISPQGKVTLLPLPKDTQAVIYGGPFAFARAEDDDGERTSYFESTSGGETWQEVFGPPVGEMEEPYDTSQPLTCSEMGCALSSSVVRVGWGSPKPPIVKKKADSDSSDRKDPFPATSFPQVTCTLEGEPEAFPPKPPTPKVPTASASKPSTPEPSASREDDPFANLPPELQEMLKLMPPSAWPAGILPPSAVPTALPSASPKTSAPKPKTNSSPGKYSPKAKAPPPPIAEGISIRTKPGSVVGQLKDKNWVGDFVLPFDPSSSQPKHVSVAAGSLEKLKGNVAPVLTERGVSLLATWDQRKAILDSSPVSLSPFEYNGKIAGAITFAVSANSGKGSGLTLLGFDEDRRVIVLVQPDASRAVFKTPPSIDPARAKVVLARRVDAPGAALVWYSATSGSVLVGAVDIGKAEVGTLSEFASLNTLTDGGLPVCSATAKLSTPTYDFIIEMAISLTVNTRTGKSKFSDSALVSSLLVRGNADHLCVTGLEVRGGGKPLDLTATFGPKGGAVARGRLSTEDPTKLSFERLSCRISEPRKTESKD